MAAAAGGVEAKFIWKRTDFGGKSIFTVFPGGRLLLDESG